MDANGWNVAIFLGGLLAGVISGFGGAAAIGHSQYKRLEGVISRLDREIQNREEENSKWRQEVHGRLMAIETRVGLM